jgi:hypothetical protein
MGFHVLTGSKILNTLSDHSHCTSKPMQYALQFVRILTSWPFSVVFQVITALMSLVFSIPRTLQHVSIMGVASAICMGIAMLLTLVYSGIQDHPGYGYAGTWPEAGEALVRHGAAPAGLGFIPAFNAVLVSREEILSLVRELMSFLSISCRILLSSSSVKFFTHPSLPRWNAHKISPRLWLSSLLQRQSCSQLLLS